jgi:hypothetical protein
VHISAREAVRSERAALLRERLERLVGLRQRIFRIEPRAQLDYRALAAAGIFSTSMVIGILLLEATGNRKRARMSIRNCRARRSFGRYLVSGLVARASVDG